MEGNQVSASSLSSFLTGLLARIRASRRSFYLCTFIILVILGCQSMTYFGYLDSYTFSFAIQKGSLDDPIVLANVRQIMDPGTAAQILKQDMKKFQSKAKVHIPKIIHQVYRDDYIPQEYGRFIKSWAEKNPGYQYWLWDDVTGRDFMRDYFPEFLPMYDAYCHDLYRSDALRYFILYKFGGIYADMDYECLKSLDDLLDAGQCYIVLEHEHQAQILFNKSIVMNLWMAAVPEHPLMKYAINNLPYSASCGNVLYVTGPLFLDNILHEYNRRTNCRSQYCRINLLPNELMMPEWDTNMASTLHILYKCLRHTGTLSVKQRKACDFFQQQGLNPKPEIGSGHYAAHKYLHLGSNAGRHHSTKVNIRKLVPRVVFPRTVFRVETTTKSNTR